MKYFTILLGSSAVLLSACGGGGGGLDEPIVPSVNNSPPVYKSISLEVNQGSPRTMTEVIALSGTSLDNGAVASANSKSGTIVRTGLTEGLSYVGEISATGNTLDNVELVAVQTSASDMPAQDLTYTGKARVLLYTGDNKQYKALMNATISANLMSNNKTVDITARGIDTSESSTVVTNGSSTNYTPVGNEEITLTGAAVSGSAFSGGSDATATGWAGDASNQIIGNVTTNTSGTFASSGAAEVAGVATAKGSGGGWYTMTFAGQK